MRLIVATDPQTTALIAAWTASRIPAMKGYGFGPCVAMAVVDRNNQPMAGIIFHDEHPQYQSVSMSIAADSRKWLTRSIISGILAYPFTTIGVGRITAITAPRESATSIWQFLEKFGFQHEGRVRKGLGDADAHLWGLLDSEWRFHRYNLARAVERPKRRRRRRGTLRLPQGAALH